MQFYCYIGFGLWQVFGAMLFPLVIIKIPINLLILKHACEAIDCKNRKNKNNIIAVLSNFIMSCCVDLDLCILKVVRSPLYQSRYHLCALHDSQPEPGQFLRLPVSASQKIAEGQSLYLG